MLTDSTRDTDWPHFIAMFNVEGIAEEVPRLTRSQSFGDPDYPASVREFFLQMAAEKPDLVIKFMRYVLKEELHITDTTESYTDPGLIAWLKSGEDSIPGMEIPATIGEKALGVSVFPDDFYKELTDQINRAFAYSIFPAVQVLSRKYLENLIIDVLRKKYGTAQLELYFDKGKGRFQGFEVLLRNLETKLPDFVGFPALDKDLLRRINQFREHGNSSAHSIELSLDRNAVEDELKELDHIVKVLVRLLSAM
jgi:hypothetical protein